MNLKIFWTCSSTFQRPSIISLLFCVKASGEAIIFYHDKSDFWYPYHVLSLPTVHPQTNHYSIIVSFLHMQCTLAKIFTGIFICSCHTLYMSRIKGQQCDRSVFWFTFYLVKLFANQLDKAWIRNLDKMMISYFI